MRHILVLAMLLGGLTPAEAAREQLTIGVGSFPSSLHPYIDPEAVKGYILGFTERALTGLDADWRNHCVMCTELPTLENGRVTLETRAGGAPGMAVRWTLRPDLFWDDGVPVTMADLAFTAKVGGNPASGFASTRTWGRVERVDIIDATTAVLHLDEPYSLYDRVGGLLSEHVEGPIVARAVEPGAYIRQTAFNRATMTPGLYNGPFRIVSYESGSQMVLEGNPAWKGAAPPFKRIVVRAIGNTAALMANLQSGDIDLAAEVSGLTIDQVLGLKEREPDRFTYLFQSALQYTHIDFQLDNPMLADVRVRRALLLGLDRAAIVKRLYGGHAELASAWVPPRDPMFDSGLPVFSYDPAKARALLAEAGWKPGEDGICRNAAGEKLSLVFQAVAGVKLVELVQQVAQSQWKAIGIETVIKDEPPRTFFGDTLKRRTFQGLAMYSWILSPSNPPRQLLASDQVPTEANNYSGSNYMNWRNAVVDAGIKVAETELDVGKRRTAFVAMQRAYAEELPVLPLYFPKLVVAIPKWLHGYEPTGTTDYPSQRVEFWRTDD